MVRAFFVSVCAVLGSAAASLAADAAAAGSQPAAESLPRIHKMADSDFAHFIEELYQSEPSATARAARVALCSIGQPYKDNATMFSRREADCVTLVEHVLAIALAQGWDDYFRLVARLRYIDGQIPFPRSGFTITDDRIKALDPADEILAIKNRNQFIIGDWNVNNAWCLRDTTKMLGADELKPWIPLHHIIRPKKLYAQKGVDVTLPDRKVVDAFIPREHVLEVLSQIESGDVVQIIKGTLEDRFCDHMGVLVIDTDQQVLELRVCIVHAAPPSVRKEPLMRFISRFPTVQGLKVLRLKPEAATAAQAESARMASRMTVPPRQ